MKPRPMFTWRGDPMIQRCLFIEGIGRCHVLGDFRTGEYFECAAIDARSVRDQAVLGMRATDTLDGTVSHRRILWSVRFTEKDAG